MSSILSMKPAKPGGAPVSVTFADVPAVARHLAQTGQSESAFGKIDKMLRGEPNDPLALFMKGALHEAVGNLDLASETLDRAALILPHEPGIRAALRRVLEQRQPPEAVADAMARLDAEAKGNGGFVTMPSLEVVYWRGYRFHVPRFPLSDPIAECIRNGKVHDEPVFNALKDYIRPGDVVLDVGANFGVMATMMSELVGADGLVYAFEANAYNFNILALNIAANELTQIKPMFNAVTDRGGQELSFPPVDFNKYPCHGSFSISMEAGAGQPITSLAIDDLNITRRIGAMKVDIQGADLLAMRGAEATIRRHRMPIIVEYEEELQAPFGTCFQDYVDFTASIGYRFHRVVDGINFLLLPAETGR